MKAVEQRLWRGGQLNRDVREGFNLKPVAKISFKWVNKPLLSTKHIVLGIGLYILIRFLSHHLSWH